MLTLSNLVLLALVIIGVSLAIKLLKGTIKFVSLVIIFVILLATYLGYNPIDLILNFFKGYIM